MTSYTAVPNVDIDPESPITTGLMTLLRDNPIAITEGSSGAPNIQQAALEQTAGIEAVTSSTIRANTISQGDIAADQIGTGELKDAFSDYTQVGIGSSTFLHAPSRSFLPAVNHNTAGNSASWDLYNTPIVMDNGATPAVFTRGMKVSGTVGSQTATVRIYYVQASPPYDLGDGEVPLFIYASIDNGTGEVVSISHSPDAIWHETGPTNSKSDFHDKSGKGYRYVKDLPPQVIDLKQKIDELRINGTPATQADIGLIRDYAAAYREAPTIAEEITQAIKNADMDLLPSAIDMDHAAANNRTVVLLDPVSDLTWQLFEMRNEVNIEELFTAGVIKVTNTKLNRNGPKGIDIIDYRFK